AGDRSWALSGFQTIVVVNVPAPRDVRRRLHPRPLPSTGVTRLHRYYGPIRLPTRPSTVPRGLPVESYTPSPHRISRVAWFSCADMPSPLPRRNREEPQSLGPMRPGPVGSAPHDGGLPGHRARSASALSISGPARRSLALRPAG